MTATAPLRVAIGPEPSPFAVDAVTAGGAQAVALGDPADALVLTPASVVPGAVIRARPIGLLRMEDEAGQDEKIICVPHDKIHPQWSEVTEVAQLPAITRDAIEHFFTHYKDLEKGKWVKVTGWEPRAAAEAAITESIARAHK